ncbi:MAG: TRAM domain-containing protein [Vicinamibacteria bacterium]|nr:TRAM domain-containing protein [Vicinamibacteria bacterium]
MQLALLRAFVVVLLAHAGYVYSPVPQRPWTGLAMGVALAFGLFALEMALRRMPGPQMVGALIGGTTGLFGARLLWANLEGVDIASQHFVHIAVIAFLTYMGVVIGVAKGDWFEPARIIAAFKDSARLHQYKILDTSVIIDGRVADLCETGFLEGTLVVPQFVLRELQQVADSSDSMKRNRGRRGLDILQKIQKMTGIHVQVVETDFPEVREVDLKLIELARRMSGKIVTNDFNLNKVAQLRGVAVLNINELANALKPVVLPGEILRVFVLKEGKESGQGVGYLDDGTMIVVDQGRRAIGRTIDVTVTSVLQTTAGKMIFCRWPDAGPDDADRPRRAANGRERHSVRIMDGRLTPMSSPAVSPTDPRLAELASSESLTPPSGTPTPSPSPERAKTD